MQQLHIMDGVHVADSAMAERGGNEEAEAHQVVRMDRVRLLLCHDSHERTGGARAAHVDEMPSETRGVPVTGEVEIVKNIFRTETDGARSTVMFLRDSRARCFGGKRNDGDFVTKSSER